MAPNSTTPVNRFIYTSKRCLKAFRSFAVRRKKDQDPVPEETEPKPSPRCNLRRESFYFSSTSIRRCSTESIDTIITFVDETINHRYEAVRRNDLKTLFM